MTSGTIRSAASVAMLALAAAALGWMDWRLAALPVSLPRVATAQPAGPTDSAPAAAIQAQATVPDFASYLVIARRPLFVPGRRVGSIPATQPESAPTLATPQWKLSGIMLKGTAARALLKADDGQPASWVRQNEEISGWRVVRIDARGVLLKSAGLEQLVELYPERVAEPAPPQ